MLEWAAEQTTEITTTAIDLEFLPTDTNVDRGVRNLEFVLEQMHTAQLDDEIKLAGLEALVPEELEKHLILHSNRLQTFEDARLEKVTHVEAKFGLRIRDSKPSDTVSRGHSDPMDVDVVNSLSLSSGKGKKVIESA